MSGFRAPLLGPFAALRRAGEGGWKGEDRPDNVHGDDGRSSTLEYLRALRGSRAGEESWRPQGAGEGRSHLQTEAGAGLGSGRGEVCSAAAKRPPGSPADGKVDECPTDDDSEIQSNIGMLRTRMAEVPIM